MLDEYCHSLSPSLLDKPAGRYAGTEVRAVASYILPPVSDTHFYTRSKPNTIGRAARGLGVKTLLFSRQSFLKACSLAGVRAQTARVDLLARTNCSFGCTPPLPRHLHTKTQPVMGPAVSEIHQSRKRPAGLRSHSSPRILIYCTHENAS